MQQAQAQAHPPKGPRCQGPNLHYKVYLERQPGSVEPSKRTTLFLPGSLESELRPLWPTWGAPEVRKHIISLPQPTVRGYPFLSMFRRHHGSRLSGRTAAPRTSSSSSSASPSPLGLAMRGVLRAGQGSPEGAQRRRRKKAPRIRGEILVYASCKLCVSLYPWPSWARHISTRRVQQVAHLPISPPSTRETRHDRRWGS